MRGQDLSPIVFLAVAIFCPVGVISGRDPITCEDIEFPCSCETLINVGADHPLLDLDCTEQELTRIPDMRPLRNAKIYRLDLGTNHIRYINDSAFAGLEFRPERQYAVLRLSQNPVEFISPNAFRGIEATKIILEMKDNGLESFPFQALQHIPSLTQLKLGFNHLTHLPYNAFEGLERLEMLGLENNPIKVLTPGIFKDQSDSLKVLRLKNTGMDELPLTELVKLKHLNKLILSENKISYLPNGLLEGLSDEVRELELDLSRNELTQVQYDVFARMTPSRKPIKVNLMLNNNRIQSLSFVEDPCATMFRVGSMIKAHHNPVSCTCELYSVILTNYFLIDVVCENPADYKGILVYASPKRGLNEVSLDYERKVEQKCRGSKLQRYDLKCIKSKKPQTTTSKGSYGSINISVKTPFHILLTNLIFLFHLR